MTEDDDDLRALLRSADLAASLPPTDPHRVARLLEDAMSDDLETTDDRRTGTRQRSPLTWLVAAAAAVLIAGVGIFALVNGTDGGDDDVPSARETPGTSASASSPASTAQATDEPEETVTRLTVAAAAGRCIVPDARLLSAQPLAFEGTVQEVTDDGAVLAPSRFYAGEATDLVRIDVPPALLQSGLQGVEFVKGGTYLVAATDGRVTGCGFSGPVTPDLTSLYAQAFPG